MILHPSHYKERIIRHAHIACGIGAGARGFNLASPRVGNLVGRFQCVGGIDVDAGAIRNFERMTGVPGTVMDLFDEPMYRAFHGKAPPAGFKEATPADIYATFGPLVDILFASYPCKGFSGLLSNAQSLTDKYQALNALTLRGMWLALEAYKHDPIPIIIFENVPRIQTRGRWLLDQICALYRSYGYNVAESVHDCGEVGGLAQSRKRFLLIMRHRDKIPNFIYEPAKQRLRGVGEVIGKLPLPGDAAGGVMHRVPALQWKTWVRLAFVPAGKDWRALNNLAVENGVLRDFGIVPEIPLQNSSLGVVGWNDVAPTITSQRAPGQGRFSVADPRPMEGGWHNEALGVRNWTDEARVVAGASRPHNGAHSVADPRPGYGDATHRHVLGVNGWDESAGTISGSAKPTTGANAVADPRYGGSDRDQVLGVQGWEETSGAVQGKSGPTNAAFSVADPRVDGHAKSVQLGVRGWDETAPCVKGDMSVGTGPYAVSDPRPQQGNTSYQQYGVNGWDEASIAVSGQSAPGGGPYSVADPRFTERKPFNNVFRIVPFEEPSPAVAGPGGPVGGLAVADPRPPEGSYKQTKYKVTPFDEAAGAVISASTTGTSAFAVADPRGGEDPAQLHGKYPVEAWEGDPSRAVIGGRDQGAFAVADPRPTHGQNAHTNKMRVVSAAEAAPTVTGSDRVGSGALSVADPRTSHMHAAGLGVTPYDAPSGVIAGETMPSNGRFAVADPRPACLNAEGREGYATQGHYGVVPWDGSTGAVPAFAKNNNGPWSVADPRSPEPEPIAALPAADDRLVARIIAQDGTWHRPFTTLELAALQSLFDPEEVFRFDSEAERYVRRQAEAWFLEGKSDATSREWIGNAVPSEAAKGMAEVMGEAILLADLGETFTLSSRDIWVAPHRVALAVDTDQEAWRL